MRALAAGSMLPLLTMLLAGCTTGGARIVDCAPGYHNVAGPDSECVAAGSSVGPAAGSLPTPGGGGAASCADAVGDGGLADIVRVDLAQEADGLRVSFQLTGPPVNSTGKILLSVQVSSGDGDIRRQLALQWTDGQARAFVVDQTGSGLQDVAAQPAVDGNMVSLTFPARTTADLASPWLWNASTSLDGTVVDQCPDAGGDSAGSRPLTFPG